MTNENNAILAGDFSSFKHIKTRKAFVIEVEFPEEMGRQVLEVLGMPIGGQSKPVAVALLNKSSIPVELQQQTEDDRLRTRAILLCKTTLFQKYISSDLFDKISYSCSESGAAHFIYDQCHISSRAELATNPEAQAKFKDLLSKYESWRLSQQYADNLNR